MTTFDRLGLRGTHSPLTALNSGAFPQTLWPRPPVNHLPTPSTTTVPTPPEKPFPAKTPTNNLSSSPNPPSTCLSRRPSHPSPNLILPSHHPHPHAPHVQPLGQNPTFPQLFAEIRQESIAGANEVSRVYLINREGLCLKTPSTLSTFWAALGLFGQTQKGGATRRPTPHTRPRHSPLPN